MALARKAYLLSSISPPIDQDLASALLGEFVSAERRFIHRDWEPTQLDGGQFAEIAARIYYASDSGIINRSKDFSDCLKYIEGDQNLHALIPRSDALHVARVLRTLYKFRSQRGAVHISPTYTPNHMDSKFMIEGVRWVMNETLRIFWTQDKEIVARSIRELLQFNVPAIGVYDGKIIVQRVDLTAEEEILILLHYSGEDGFSRNDLGLSAKVSPSSVTRAVQKLESAQVRQIIKMQNSNFRLTDLGSKRIREQLADKLLSM